jgi:hypothetical protein
MMSKVVNRAFDAPEHVKVGRLSGQRHSRGGEGGLAIESGAGENGAGKKMSDWFQVGFNSTATGAPSARAPSELLGPWRE